MGSLLWLGVLAAAWSPALSDQLFLTPLLEAGDVEAARRQAAVPPLLPDCGPSYAGFLTVDKQLQSNMFFWFFEAEARDAAAAPLVVWLQGGPGTSMMRTVLLEHGPLQLLDSGELRRRTGSWTRAHSVLYIDNPVGTGFSFTRDPAGYSRDLAGIAANLYEALDQFFALFPDQRARDLYVAGESYGGKMAIGLAHHLHTRNGEEAEDRRMRLRGVMIINGLIEAESQLDKSDIAYEMGMVDEAGRDAMKANVQRQFALIKTRDYEAAVNVSSDECGGTLSFGETGLLSVTNMLLFNGTQDHGFIEFSELPRIREALHVGDTPFHGRATTVGEMLSGDTLSSALSKLAELADQDAYRILVANGQLDMCLPYRLSANVLRKMQWKGADEWGSSRRVTWCSREELAGYARTVRGLTQVLVRNAGHYLAQDQPLWAADMLRRFTSGASFDTCALCYNNFQ